MDWKSNYKSMSYEQLSREADRLICDGWFKNLDKLNYIHTEMWFYRKAT